MSLASEYDSAVRVLVHIRVLVHVLVQYEVSLEKFYLRCALTCTGSRTSTIRSFAQKVLFKVHAHLPLVRESEV